MTLSVFEEREKLEKENAELKNKFESDELALNEANEIIAELKAQIEKMKCCGNCAKHKIHTPCPYYYDSFSCKHDGYKEWELEK